MLSLTLLPVLLLTVDAHRTSWDLHDYSWLKLERSEAGARPNDHPARLAPETLIRLLSAVTVATPEGTEPLLAKDELDRLRKDLPEALAQARPDEDLLLLSSSRRGTGLLGSALTVTARLFVLGGELNLIVHDARLDYVARVLTHTDGAPLAYGSRTGASQELIQAEGARSVRKDWLAFPLALQPAKAPEPVPGAAAPGAPSIENRLQQLKKLLDDHFITEEEYKAKREQILNSL